MSVFDKLHELKDALHGDSADRDSGGHKGQEEARAESHEQTKKEEKEGWSDKLRDVLDGGDAKREAKRQREEEEERVRIEKEKAEAKAKVDAERGWTAKIHDALDGGKHKQELEEAEFKRLETQAQAEKKKDLSDHFDHALNRASEFKDKVVQLTRDPREKADEHEEAEQEHLTDKVKSLWDKAPKEEKAAQNEHKHIWEQVKDEEDPDTVKRASGGWRDQLSALTGANQKEEKQKVERSWLKEKFNEMAGGGQASEADEDKLDKTIDFIQAHILHEGDQSNESALEQLKDEQISDAIRVAYNQVTGREFPAKDK
ncbi:unnamed protein product [Somion occarium]|uniref:Uncharacterized protein n=1 Tax=Somion occarium TaxID=3059160 RepID=A0ABP1DQP9_9APHY